MLNLLKRHVYLISAASVLVLLVLLLSLRSSRPDSMSWLDATLQTLVVPFQTVYHGTRSAVSELLGDYVHLVNLKQDNARLQLQVQSLQEELNHYINSSVQFDLLREQLKFMEEAPESKVFAEVTGESVDNFHHVLLINKGSMVGIRRNFPVVLREGVVGRVQSTSAMHSVVQLITDRRHRFPVLIQRSRNRLVLHGEGGQLRLLAQDRGMVFGTGDSLNMNRIRMLADVQIGDRIVTSGLAGIFPKGLLVGTVTQISRERQDLFQNALLEPAVDFNRLEGVFVILRDPRESTAPLFATP